MKTLLKNISIAILFLVVLTSCMEEEFLKEVPLDFYSTDNSFVTYENYQAALVDIYAQVRDMKFNPGEIGYAHLYGTDMMFNARRTSDGLRFGNYVVALNPTSSIPAYHWDRLYKIVTSANSIIERLEENTVLTDEQKVQVDAEARFFRALGYRNLMYLFGGVPLLLNEVTSPKTDFTRASREEVVNQIVSDLQVAAANLPEINEVEDGRISNLVANHYLAELYIVQGKWEEAIAAASIVIDDPGTALMTSRFGSLANQPGDVFYDLFRVGNQNRSGGNTEALWVAQFEVDILGGVLTSTGLGGNIFERVHAPAVFTLTDPDGKTASLGSRSNLNSGGRGVSFMRPTSYMEQFVWKEDFEGDMRNSEYNYVRDFIYDDPRSAWFDSSAVKYPGKNLVAESWRWYPWISKVTTPGQHPANLIANSDTGLLTNGAGSTYSDQYYLRLAETYLIRAEAFLGKGDLQSAANDINQLRTRANAKPVLAGEVTIDYILDERARELSFEEDRRLTLARLNKVVERVRKYNDLSGPTILDHHGLWPIPAREIEANINGNLEQNPGY
ncbi:RagB/SusD family nutrient uptake outer membrane protein [Algoriphagus aestuariicola]|uniref:RagB/SusD family nutrient uptake outer membrane protein n=1 Tax=Algoriphagus aestuariicola TaxID=1852016 RepID=A0ABS3BL83_9BACT|nr:RagB/SusD family nutrient uptake outer membrane protein [Algoriphagus aestuariicola]MBN7800067.1 RagB/SusD family nutrient uptake outer membrane protein [Algoriphagus aestuariicola]